MTRYFAVSNLHELGPLEVHKLYKLRVDVFVHEQGTPYAEIDDADAATSTHHILAWERAASGVTVLDGCARLIPTTVADLAAATGSTLTLDDAPVSQLGRLAVAREFRGTGLADEIMHNALRLAHEKHPSNDVVLTAQSPLRSFYEGYGFSVCGSEFLDSGVAHLPLVLGAAELADYATAPRA
ncbi:GNAT family N-acetyltransferase [Corynebacterium pacaense]|uniref:GNAT family N-acetyltransferase n=1 Tax=Corynebacterium pacaense TaxID=1816684 RepID=UPI0009B9EC16|nr:GNAT family N-acetyltransferase [Corynebacterium pacaense]